ncbi:MAG: peptide chain release factor N(5)-glutamine methyltransferase [Propionibacteriaceae bacterium]|nr:peptide chain release factor N(5)-glutamine methyltransferase [Propionibacteriaceae bacterium]
MRASALLADGARRLVAAGLPSPQADARILLAHALSVEPSELALTSVDDAGQARFRTLLNARAAGQPVQYLTGVAYFRTVAVHVGPGVFIPRPETESLAGWAIEALRQGRTRDGRAPVVVELCAGSGAISASIAAELPGCEQHAVELSPDAFAYLRANVPGAHLVLADMDGALPELDGTVDVVVANPPYIPDTDRALVAADVLAHEPELALFSGPDGLDALRVVVRVAARLLRPGGWVGIEHDESTGSGAVAALEASSVFEQVQDRRDLAGRPRFVTARLAG